MDPITKLVHGPTFCSFTPISKDFVQLKTMAVELLCISYFVIQQVLRLKKLRITTKKKGSNFFKKNVR